MAITHPGIDLDFGADVPQQVTFPLRLKGLPRVVAGATFYIGMMINGSPMAPVPVTFENGQPVAHITAQEGASVQTSLGYATMPGGPLQWIPNSSKTIQVPAGAMQIPEPQVGLPSQSPVVPNGSAVIPSAPTRPSLLPGQQNFPNLAPAANSLSQNIRGPILSILDAVKNPEKAGALSALLEILENRIHQYAEAHSIPPSNRDFSVAVAHELQTVLLADAQLPHTLRQQLERAGMPSSMADLQKTLLLGRKQYRNDVLALLKTNPEAQKLFGITRTQKLDVESPFSNPEHNRLFDVACSSHDFGALAVNLNSLIGELSRLPKRNVKEADVQRKLHESVMNRLSPEELSSVQKWIQKWKPRAINQAVQLAGYGASYALGSWTLGLAYFMGRPALESLSGVNASDIKLAIKENRPASLLKLFWDNNVFRQSATVKEKLKDAGINFIKKAMPLAPLAADEKSTLSESTKSSEALTLLRTACTQASS